jgi:hypothetical protein
MAGFLAELILGQRPAAAERVRQLVDIHAREHGAAGPMIEDRKTGG